MMWKVTRRLLIMGAMVATAVVAVGAGGPGAVLDAQVAAPSDADVRVAAFSRYAVAAV